MYNAYETAKNPASHIRFLNASPNTPSINIYVNGKLVANTLKYNGFTEYQTAKPGLYTIECRLNGPNSGLSFSETVELMPDSIYTMAVAGTTTNLSFAMLYDTTHNKHNEGSYIRFSNLCPYDTVLNFHLNDADTANGLYYKEVTDYIKVAPGTYRLKIYNAKTGALVLEDPKVQIKANKSYAGIVTGLMSSQKELEILLPLEGSSYTQ